MKAKIVVAIRTPNESRLRLSPRGDHRPRSASGVKVRRAGTKMTAPRLSESSHVPRWGRMAQSIGSPSQAIAKQADTVGAKRPAQAPKITMSRRRDKSMSRPIRRRSPLALTTISSVLDRLMPTAVEGWVLASRSAATFPRNPARMNTGQRRTLERNRQTRTSALAGQIGATRPVCLTSIRLPQAKANTASPAPIVRSTSALGLLVGELAKSWLRSNTAFPLIQRQNYLRPPYFLLTADRAP